VTEVEEKKTEERVDPLDLVLNDLKVEEKDRDDIRKLVDETGKACSEFVHKLFRVLDRIKKMNIDERKKYVLARSIFMGFFTLPVEQLIRDEAKVHVLRDLVRFYGLTPQDIADQSGDGKEYY